MQVLVLGASGFIGGHIAKAALAQGWQVRGLRRNPKSTGHLDDPGVEWVSGDLNQPESLVQAMQGCEIVFHAAAYYPSSSNPRKVSEHIGAAQTEIAGVLGAAQKANIRRFVYTSTLTTIAAPPPNSNRLADESDVYQLGTLPKSGYYECKIVMENAIFEYPGSDLDVVVLNPTAVFGPGDIHITLGGLLITVARGMAKAWLPGAVNVVDVRDVAEAHVGAAIKGLPGERYIIGGHNFTVREALTIAAEVAGVPPPRFELPMWLIDVLVWLGELFPILPLPSNHMRTLRHWQTYNTEKAQTELGLTPRKFEETVSAALEWFKAHGEL